MGDESGGPFNLPLELVTLIFLYLPVKSLLRFTCVCKTWMDLIRNDRHFAINHYLTRTTFSSYVLDQVDYILEVIRRSDKPCFYSFTEAKTFRLLKKFECVPDIRIWVSNTCHGIICFYFRFRTEILILLCNPSIQEVVLLPPCPIMGVPVMGFDPINNDYKIVAIHCPDGDVYPCTASVYSVRRGHWQNLDVSDPLSYIFSLEGFAALNANGRKCNQLFYKTLESGSFGEGLVSFDMVEEVFKEIPMPECLFPRRHTHELLSSTQWQACLSCLQDRCNSDFSGVFIDVWVLKGSGERDHCEDWVWSKQFVVKHPGHEPMRPLNVWMNDKELLVLIKKGYNEEVFHYDLDTQQLRRTGHSGVLSCWSGGGYVESLVSIKHFMSLHSEDAKQSDDQVEASKQQDTNEYQFREVSRKGVRWSCSFKLQTSK